MNIDPKLFESWKASQRRGDIKTMAKALGVSEPVMGNALRIGYVCKIELMNSISEYFTKRNKESKGVSNTQIKSVPAEA